jgi:cytochrome c-type protein NapC
MKFFTNPKWWKTPKAWYYFGIPGGAIVFFVFGILFWGGFNTAMELTNTEKFCISCHEMAQTVYPEYKESPHYNPVSGVSATCPDCHVPKPWGYKMIRKMQASMELWHKMMGTIDTPEKFEAKRFELASNVWRAMKATDSRECRNCHTLERMNLAKQSKRARKKHDPEKMKAKGKTCIDCHKGIAHNMPEEPDA